MLAAVAGYAIRGGDSGGGGATTVAAGQAPAVYREAGDARATPATLRLANVDQMPGDKVLEAWVQRDGEVESVPAASSSPTATGGRPR